MIRSRNFWGLLSGFWLLASGFGFSAQAENPWAQHYATRTLPEPEISAHEAAYRITYGQARENIALALERQQAGENIRVSLPRKDEEIMVSGRTPITAEIDKLTYDTKSHTWQAMIYFTADGKPLPPASLTGRYDEMVDIPTLKHRIGSGEIITADDIEMQPYKRQRLREETVTDADQLIGKAPKRTISANRPIRQREVVAPSVVSKGETVAVIYKNNAMEIRTLGEALQDGGQGDIIRIRNQDSHATIQAQIVDKGLARILPLGSAATQISAREMP